MSNDELSKLRQQVAELEWRLAKHHEALNDAIDQRDKFALNSSWGIVKAAAFISSFIAANYIFKEWLEWEGWLAGILSGVLALVILGLLGVYIEKGETGDQGKLYRLPEWKSRDWSEYE